MGQLHFPGKHDILSGNILRHFPCAFPVRSVSVVSRIRIIYILKIISIFPFRKLQSFISFHFVSFRFVSLRFSNYGKPCEDFENTSGSSSSEDSYGENEPDLTLDCSVIKATIGTVTSAACGNKALSIIDHTSQKKPRFNKIKEQFEREPLSCDLEKRSSFCCSHFC